MTMNQPYTTLESLPEPGARDMKRSRALVARIGAETRGAGQSMISFQRFMELALYASGLGIINPRGWNSGRRAISSPRPRCRHYFHDARRARSSGKRRFPSRQKGPIEKIPSPEPTAVSSCKPPLPGRIVKASPGDKAFGRNHPVPGHS